MHELVRSVVMNYASGIFITVYVSPHSGFRVLALRGWLGQPSQI
jgi:hypothetical protein